MSQCRPSQGWVRKNIDATEPANATILKYLQNKYSLSMAPMFREGFNTTDNNKTKVSD